MIVIEVGCLTWATLTIEKWWNSARVFVLELDLLRKDLIEWVDIGNAWRTDYFDDISRINHIYVSPGLP